VTEPVKRKKRNLPKIISSEEAASVLAAADDGTNVGLRNRLMLDLMYRAGLRVSEVCDITPRQIHRDGTIDIFDAKGGDGTAYFDADRILPQLDRWLEIRKDWYNGPKGPMPNLFIKPNGFRVSPRYLQRLMVKLRADIGITGVLTPHVLRHTFATENLEEGLSLVEVQSLLRHAHMATTTVYLHVRDKALRDKMSRRGKR
jgi:site-specific recombinase XerD